MTTSIIDPLPSRVEDTARLTRGARRTLWQMGLSAITEFTLPSGRHADLIAIAPSGEITIVEVKSGIDDFRADAKWPEYREWCDHFWFAIAEDFPRQVIPPDCGIMIADAYEAALLRTPEATRLAPARRKALTIRFALAAAQRVQRLEDPGLTGL